MHVPELDAGFHVLYELKPEEARGQFEAWHLSDPEDPLGSASVAASYLFEECIQQGVLTSEFFLDNKRPFSGTWKFDPAKGNLTPPIPKSVVAHIDANDTDFKFKQEGVDDKGQPMTMSYEAKFDGKDYPVAGDPNSDSVVLQRINQREVKFTNKKSGKVVSVTDAVVSKDGQTATVNYTDYDSSGKATKGVAIYHKE